MHVDPPVLAMAGFQDALHALGDEDVMTSIREMLLIKPHLCGLVMEMANEISILAQQQTGADQGYQAAAATVPKGMPKGKGKEKGKDGDTRKGLGKGGPRLDGEYYAGGRRFDGVIKSYVEKSNYGFIACDETYAVFGSDCFLAAYAVTAEIEVGAAVSFTVKLNKQGKPQAFDLGPPGGPALGDFGELGEAGGVEAAASAAAGADEDRFHGLIKSFNTKSSYGFISSPELFQMFGCDAFMAGKSIPAAFEVGDACTFTVQPNKEGKPQAYDVQITAGGKGVKRKQVGW